MDAHCVREERVLSRQHRGDAIPGRVEVKTKRQNSIGTRNKGCTERVVICCENHHIVGSARLFACDNQRNIQQFVLAPGEERRISEKGNEVDIALCLSSWGRLEDDSTNQCCLEEEQTSPNVYQVDFSLNEPMGMRLEQASHGIVVHSVVENFQAWQLCGPEVLAGATLRIVNDTIIYLLDDFEAIIRRAKESNATMMSLGFSVKEQDAVQPQSPALQDQWQFATGAGIGLLAKRESPSSIIYPKIPERIHTLFKAVPSKKEKRLYLRIRDCRPSNVHTLRIFISSLDSNKQSDASTFPIKPGDYFQHPIVTSQRLILHDSAKIHHSSEDKPHEDDEVLALKFGDNAVFDLIGFSLVWQPAHRHLSCISQSRINIQPPSLEHLRHLTNASASARVKVIEDCRAASRIHPQDLYCPDDACLEKVTSTTMKGRILSKERSIRTLRDNQSKGNDLKKSLSGDASNLTITII